MNWGLIFVYFGALCGDAAGATTMLIAWGFIKWIKATTDRYK